MGMVMGTRPGHLLYILCTASVLHCKIITGTFASVSVVRDHMLMRFEVKRNHFLQSVVLVDPSYCGTANHWKNT